MSSALMLVTDGGQRSAERNRATEAPKKAAGVVLDLRLPTQIFRFRVRRFDGEAVGGPRRDGNI